MAVVQSGGGEVVVAPMARMLKSFVCRSPVNGLSELSFGRGASSSSFQFAVVAGFLRSSWGCLGQAVDWWWWSPPCLDCFDFHCRRLGFAIGLYIWERPARINGDASFLLVCATVVIEVVRILGAGLGGPVLGWSGLGCFGALFCIIWVLGRALLFY
ncbi:uncharacterized protein LOC131320370 [Rhododendron vialii]|uniref:uncharacterized protein LOC131320370 n=1 Tax=Rhododendron vialii TaxID=182163 RepID=UPI00265EDC55|nr:uncharacterized protein LOC131320370 [Rhododendron vialii]